MSVVEMVVQWVEQSVVAMVGQLVVAWADVMAALLVVSWVGLWAGDLVEQMVAETVAWMVEWWDMKMVEHSVDCLVHHLVALRVVLMAAMMADRLAVLWVDERVGK